MALPASVPTGTVTGTWYTPKGDLAVGTIVFLLLESVEIPDDPDGVVIPIKTVVEVPAGQLNQILPEGMYQVSVRLSELYRITKVVEVVQGVALNLPDAVGMLLPDPDYYDPVRSVNGQFPDASGNITVSGGGGGAVDSVFGRTGAVVGANNDYTKAQVGLGSVDNTSDASKPISTATQTALDGKQPFGSYASAASVAERGVQAFGTTGKITGTFGPGDTSGSWTMAGAPWRVTVAASVGDILSLDPSIITQVGADAEMDVCSVVGGSPARYYSSGTASQGPNGHGGLYMGTQFGSKMGHIKWVVTADDISSGNVTLSYMYRAGSGITWGSNAYPNEITLINLGTP